jgi:hypothetical protein
MFSFSLFQINKKTVRESITTKDDQRINSWKQKLKTS